MDFIFKCPNCEQALAVDVSGCGYDIECPACGETVTVPTDDTVTVLKSDTVTVPTSDSNCPICGLLTTGTKSGYGESVDCPRCGTFEVLDRRSFIDLPLSRRAIVSAWVRKNQNFAGAKSNIKTILETRPPTVPKKAELLLVFLAESHPKPGTLINITHQYSPKDTLVHTQFGASLFAVCWCEDEEEFNYLINTYLIIEKKYLKKFGDSIVISPEGWSFIESLSQPNSNSLLAFVAMWFDPTANSAWTAMNEGIRQAGYEPFRIDRKEHNNKIDDEIVLTIRRSKFLVADFTGHRGGVYFEAGFAMGLGLPVIWLCRKDELDKTHFDTRQYNFIIWEGDKLMELSRSLQNRIEATIGRGPLRWTPKTRPVVKMDFYRSDERKQIDESKTQTAQ